MAKVTAFFTWPIVTNMCHVVLLVSKGHLILFSDMQVVVFFLRYFVVEKHFQDRDRYSSQLNN